VPELIFGGTKANWSRFHILHAGLVFDGTEGIVSRFHILRARSHFQRYGGSRVPFSCFARPDSFLGVLRASVPIFLFCSPTLVFGGTEGVGSRFYVLRSWTHFRRYRGRPIPFSSFVRPYSFSEVPRCHVHFSCFVLKDSFSAVPRAYDPVFMFCALGLIFVGTEGVGSRFYVLHARTHLRPNQGRRVPFSCFAHPDSFSTMSCASGPVFSGNEGVGSRCHVLLPNSFSAVPRASGPVFMFCSPGLVFDGNEGVGSRFHVFRAHTSFRRDRGCRVPFSCLARPSSDSTVPMASGTSFALPDSFSAVLRASGPIFMFCAPEVVFGGTEGVRSRFNVLRARTHIRRYRGRWVPFSCFALLDLFSVVPKASGPVLMYCGSGLVFSCTEGVGPRFHVFRARTRFRRYRGRRVPFSCFLCPDSLSAVSRTSSPVFLFCTPTLIFSGTEGVGSCFYVLRARFHVLYTRTHFRRYRGSGVSHSCLARPHSFSAVPRASGHIFMFCAPRPIFGVTEGVGSRFHVLLGLFFGGIEGVGFLFHVLCYRTHFRRFRGRSIPFSFFARPDSFSAVRRASGPVLVFCAPGLFFGGTEGVGSHFHVLRSRTYFRRYRGRRVPFSCFTLIDSFSAVPRAYDPVFMFCAPGLVFGDIEGVRSCFYTLHARTGFHRYRGRRVPISCFERPDSFSAVPIASGPIYMFCAPEHVFRGIDGVGSYFHVMRSRTHFR
jgi:hypothetical protein